MTALNTFFLIVGMAVIGVPLIINLLSPIVGAIVVRLLPENAWDGAMLLFAQAGAALATLLVGRLLLDLPWLACAIAAVLVGITSYARRAPDEFDYGAPLGGYSDIGDVAYADHRADDPDRDRGVEYCPECEKRCRGEQALSQHIAAKHPTIT